METQKQYGNRRTDEELERVTAELNELTYALEEQSDFKGNEDQLRMMQNLERAYIDGYPKVSDEEWDILKKKFNYQESLISVAPSGRTWVRLLAPLPSIDKAGNLEELQVFCTKYEGEELLYEPKLDGLTANTRYVLDGDEGLGVSFYRKDCITSRGNGRYGLKLHEHALSGVRLNGVPEFIDVSYVESICGDLPEYFELRGEGVIKKTEKNLMKYRGEQQNDLAEVVVWRSVVSGIFNRKVPANLNGVLLYLYGKDLGQLVDNEGFFFDEMNGRVYVENNLQNARLIASLGNDQHKFLRTSMLSIREDGYVEIRHADGNSHGFYDEGEELDVVCYSCAVNGLNKDTEKIRDIPGVIFVGDILRLDDKPTQFYGKTKNAIEVLEKVCEFYGCDLNGKRVSSKSRYRNLHQYALDGLVVKLANSTVETQGLDIRNSKSNNSKLVIPKYPADQIACKLLSERVLVTVKSIEERITSLKNVTCQAVLDKAYQTESGAWVESVNLHNGRWLGENSWIQEGKTYWMVMAFDIIPQLLPIEVEENGESFDPMI